MISRRTFVGGDGRRPERFAAGVSGAAGPTAQAIGRRHHRMARALARLAHGGTLPPWLSRCRALAYALRFTSSPPMSIRLPRTISAGARFQEFGFTIHRTIAEALRAGSDRLNVDAVLIIGEHGNYPVNKLGQKEYHSL